MFIIYIFILHIINILSLSFHEIEELFQKSLSTEELFQKSLSTEGVSGKNHLHVEKVNKTFLI